ncbi:glutathione S-transferase 2-like isoform X1 [Phalaenopsis equestris]|uniref:glutathione S-transferase 2-like isoform X1 n=1 Tax=Phalaenopsis equestris TaxID=78828 RepID=UPI0009E352F6|nr:glutathione S-transferase 2-like isoform X1 [Phalaenopsis equestris]
MGDTAKLQLYSYWRSSSSHRVRIALNLKGLAYEYKSVNLLKNEQSSPEFAKLNPQKCVPVLVDGDTVIADSFVISLYLEDKYPEHPLLPRDLKTRALNLQVASIVGSSIQPFHNLSVLNYIEGKLNAKEKVAWAQYHINNGLEALEKLLEKVAGYYATGDEAQLADIFLAPQILAAERFEIDMSRYPTLAWLKEAYDEDPAFQAALPTNQPDAPSPSAV